MSGFKNVTPAIWKSKTPKTGWSGGYIFSCLIGSVELFVAKVIQFDLSTACHVIGCPILFNGHSWCVDVVFLATFIIISGQLPSHVFVHRKPIKKKEKEILPLLRFPSLPIKPYKVCSQAGHFTFCACENLKYPVYICILSSFVLWWVNYPWSKRNPIPSPSNVLWILSSTISP
jgi:hypothetical protein